MTQSFAVVFPGQGSQSVGMLAGLATHPEVTQTFAEASEALGQDLWALVTGGPAAELDRTELTQPAMLTAGVATWRVIQPRLVASPCCVAGHSLGEYSALVAAGALGLADAVRLVAERGRLMQAAVPAGEGSMAAILGLDDEQVRALCAEVAGGEVLAAVNFNAPGQVVIAGAAAAVERGMAAAKAAGAKRALPLPVSVPSHCALMRPAAEQLANLLAAVPMRDAAVPVIQNFDATAHTDAAALRQGLAQQLYSPVLWVDSVRTMAAAGATVVLESGPGKVLAGLNKRIDKTLGIIALVDDGSLDAAVAAVNPSN